jgi:hypothetical protein
MSRPINQRSLGERLGMLEEFSFAFLICSWDE